MDAADEFGLIITLSFQGGKRNPPSGLLVHDWPNESLLPEIFGLLA
jgi:hypothetical protein